MNENPHLIGAQIESISSVPWLIWVQFALFLAGCCAATFLSTRSKTHLLILGSCMLFAVVRIPDLLSLTPAMQGSVAAAQTAAKLLAVAPGLESLGIGLLVTYLFVLCRGT